MFIEFIDFNNGEYLDIWTGESWPSIPRINDYIYCTETDTEYRVVSVLWNNPQSITIRLEH